MENNFNIREIINFLDNLNNYSIEYFNKYLDIEDIKDILERLDNNMSSEIVYLIKIDKKEVFNNFLEKSNIIDCVIDILEKS